MAWALLGCSPERDPATLFAADAVGTLVVDAALIVDQPLPRIRLSRTQAPDVAYDPRDAEVGTATVVVRTGPTEFEYTFLPGNERVMGRYVPLAGSPPEVLPETRYDLEIVTEKGERLTATTTTPRRFSVETWALSVDGTSGGRNLQTFADQGDGVYFHPDNLLTYPEGVLDAHFSGGDATAYGAAGFQLGLFSLDREAGLVIDPPFLDEEDLEDLPRLGSSPALDGEDGYVRLPWFSIFYDGRHLYKAFAVDRNWFDLIRTIPEGGGGFGPGGNIGDGVDPPLFRVEGGIGLFGSASVDSVGFFIRPVP